MPVAGVLDRPHNVRVLDLLSKEQLHSLRQGMSSPVQPVLSSVPQVGAAGAQACCLMCTA